MINEQWINSLNKPEENVVEKIDENDPGEQPEKDLTYIRAKWSFVRHTAICGHRFRSN